MKVFVVSPFFRFSSFVFPDGSEVQNLLDRFVPDRQDFYVLSNGRRSHLNDPLHHGAVYHLEPRLCGGKGGFGSMLRALGAQIEKTTNREACRDLSGRRLRDVNHEKEMAEWLKKQADREAEKEQRRLERLHRKLAEPKHQFTDAEYQRQCHDMSERLEDSVLKGLQASSSGQVKADDVMAVKRLNSGQSDEPQKKKKKKTTGGAAGCYWMGLDDLPSSEEEEEDEDDESPSTSSSSYGCGAAATVTMAMLRAQPEGAESEEDSRSSTEYQTDRPSKDQDPTSQPSEVQTDRFPQVQTSGEQNLSETSKEESTGPSEVQDQNQTSRPSEDWDPPQTPQIQTEDLEQSGAPESSRASHQSDPLSSTSVQQLDLSSMSSVQQLESLGLDVLKKELMSRGLKCGGTLSERAARLFSIRGLRMDQIDAALLAKPAKANRK
ncbi:splicing regulator SDE2 isoform 2-T2 [Pholidichthys leucotaenia]